MSQIKSIRIKQDPVVLPFSGSAGTLHFKIRFLHFFFTEARTVCTNTTTYNSSAMHKQFTSHSDLGITKWNWVKIVQSL